MIIARRENHTRHNIHKTKG